jgi:hypothetical protein
MSNLIPRLEWEAFHPDLKAVLEARVKRLGYLGEFFKCVAHVPQTLAYFMEMTEQLKKDLPDNLTELVSLTVAKLASNEYERNQHERLSRRLGFSLDWIREANACEPDKAKALKPEEVLVQRYSIAAFKSMGKGIEKEFEAMIKAIGPKYAMGVVMLIGRYITHAIAVNSLKLVPPVPSVFEQDVV